MKPAAEPGSVRRAAAPDGTALAWMGDIERMILAPAPARLPGLPVQVYGDLYERVPFEGFMARLAHHYGRVLKEAADRHPRSSAIRGMLTTAAWASLIRNLVGDVLSVCHHTLIVDMHLARARGELAGATPQERYAHYDSHMLRDRRYLTSLFANYPVLGRTLVRCAHNWVRNSVELLDRLAADIPLLRQEGIVPDDESRVLRIQTGLGDPHHGGRSVAQVTFTDGGRVVYKPRPLDAEDLYRQVIAQVNAARPELGLRAMKVVVRGEYGWCEFVEHEGASGHDGVRDFYRRVGACAAVLMYLGAADMHMENLVANGDFPVPIDLETIVQPPAVAGTPVGSAEDVAFALLGDSVMATGLLPRRTGPGDGIRGGVDNSAIGGGVRRGISVKAPRLVEPFTDLMRVETAETALPASRNLPFLRDRESDGQIDPGDHIPEMLAGFRDAYDVMAGDKPAFAELLRRSAGTVIRYLVRPTRVYGLLLYEGHQPRHLRDALDAERLTDVLGDLAEGRPELSEVVEAERRSLLAGDVPSFQTTPSSTSLRIGSGASVENFFAEPGLAAAERRLWAFGEQHRAAQLRILTGALSTLPRARSGTGAAMPRRGESGEQMASFETTARRAVREVARSVIQGVGDCTWIGLIADSVPEETLDYGPLPARLYDGLPGMALMFAYAAEVLDEEEYLTLAVRCMRPVLSDLGRDLGDGRPRQVGAYTGICGTLYVLDHLAAVSGRTEYLDLIGRCAPYLYKCLDGSHPPDVVTGYAGAAVVCAELYARHGFAELRDSAVLCLERLAAGTAVRQADPAGFGFGAAGIGWALLSAGRLVADTAAMDTGLRMITEVGAARSDADRGGAAGGQEAGGGAGWCRGDTGTAIACLLAHRLSPHPGLLREARRSLTAACSADFMDSSLCHGHLGRLDLLGLAAEAFPEEERWGELRSRALEALADETGAGGGVTSLPGDDAPGLMRGKAGACISLLRSVAPAKVPSVLWLAAPAGP
ncbi:type 2 lanthipeptide synthetase LanM family protein [Microbispora sp. ZYX-F-249]|uniref:Type 2 lanthipeptide synthetase LanM family protein n=1 Tax=Microbispora maris TaxID=3144104 RepID=A0ABV0ALX9_9ACTN